MIGCRSYFLFLFSLVLSLLLAYILNQILVVVLTQPLPQPTNKPKETHAKTHNKTQKNPQQNHHHCIGSHNHTKANSQPQKTLIQKNPQQTITHNQCKPPPTTIHSQPKPPDSADLKQHPPNSNLNHQTVQTHAPTPQERDCERGSQREESSGSGWREREKWSQSSVVKGERCAPKMLRPCISAKTLYHLKK